MSGQGDLHDDPVEDLARWLRSLRNKRGAPSLQTIVGQVRDNDPTSSLVISTLSNAFNGRALPQYETVIAIARALGGPQAAADAEDRYADARTRRDDLTRARRHTTAGRDVRPDTLEGSGTAEPDLTDEVAADPDDGQSQPAAEESRSDVVPDGAQGAAESEVAGPASTGYEPPTQPARQLQPQRAGRPWGRRRAVVWTAAVAAVVALAVTLTFVLTGSHPTDQAGHGARSGTPSAKSSMQAAGGSKSTAKAEQPLIQGGWRPSPCGYTWAAKGEASGDSHDTHIAPRSSLQITAQASSHAAVLLMGLRLVNVKRLPMPNGGTYSSYGQCGGDQATRSYRAVLDSRPPTISSVAAGDFEATIPPVPPRYKISDTDPEVFEVFITNTTCLCNFSIAVDWVAAGKPGTTLVDNDGKGFTTVPDTIPGARWAVHN